MAFGEHEPGQVHQVCPAGTSLLGLVLCSAWGTIPRRELVCNRMAAMLCSCHFYGVFWVAVFKFDLLGDQCSLAALQNLEGQQLAVQGGSDGCGSAEWGWGSAEWASAASTVPKVVCSPVAPIPSSVSLYDKQDKHWRSYVVLVKKLLGFSNQLSKACVKLLIWRI